ncbi:hypothetical protein D5274_10340 [bacterium 1XD42-94]|nr:hypothetical protein [bacterium 1XD42-76]NBK05532.1 hypothetical protein [bacterium 1XD42-94]
MNESNPCAFGIPECMPLDGGGAFTVITAGSKKNRLSQNPVIPRCNGVVRRISAPPVVGNTCFAAALFA